MRTWIPHAVPRAVSRTVSAATEARLRLRGIPAAVLVLLLLPAAAAGQEVVGEVMGSDRRTLSDASLGLFGSDGEMVASTTSGASGGFTLTAPSEGLYTLHATRRGYRSVSGGPYAIAAGSTLEVMVVLHPAPEALDPIEVEVEPGRSGRLAIRGFYERETRLAGWFFDREDIERNAGTYLTELLDRRVPRVTMDRRNRLLGADVVRNPGIVFDKGGQFCAPAFWVDGVLIRDGGVGAEPVRVDDWVGPEEAEGIEFYAGPASIPIEFAHSGACAVLVVWTRGGR